MSAKTVDVLIFIPLIPAIPIIATWFLPWESWIPKKVPKSIIGPYLLYCSFAAWHFKMSSWSVMLAALVGTVVCVMAVFDVLKAKRLEQARDWPVAEGSVLQVGESRDDDGFHVTLTYTYKVQGERFGGSESFVFKKDQDAVRFKERCKERVRVHYRPDEPQVSVLARE